MEFDYRVLCGDAIEKLKNIPQNSIDCCITSPPYYALRNYGHELQIGMESTPAEYVRKLVAVFEEVKRTMKKSGTLWVNIGDTYAGTGDKKGETNIDKKNPNRNGQKTAVNRNVEGCKRKDMIGIPWLFAFAMRDAGWYLRNDIIWHKPNAMPAPVKDRFTNSYEHVFLFTLSEKYWFDAEAVREQSTASKPERRSSGFIRARNLGYNTKRSAQPGAYLMANNKCEAGDQSVRYAGGSETRNRRDVWDINTKPSREKHIAQYPEELVRVCLLAGCPQGGTVLDPFIGSGTTGIVAKKYGRSCIGVELNQEYAELAQKRIDGIPAPLF